MMKHTQTIFGKYWRRGYSSIASPPLSSAVKQGWAKQDGLALFGAFFGGFGIHSCINIYKRRKHWYKVENLSKENDKRFEEVMTKSFQWMTAMDEASRKRMLDRKKGFKSD